MPHLDDPWSTLSETTTMRKETIDNYVDAHDGLIERRSLSQAGYTSWSRSK